MKMAYVFGMGNFGEYEFSVFAWYKFLFFVK